MQMEFVCPKLLRRAQLGQVLRILEDSLDSLLRYKLVFPLPTQYRVCTPVVREVNRIVHQSLVSNLIS